MHQITALTLALSFLFFTGCEDKKPDQNTIHVENTTVVVMEEKQHKVNGVEEKTAVIEDVAEETDSKPVKKIGDTFKFFDMTKEVHTATITQEGLKFQDNTKSIVLIQFFATWCDPCIGEIAYLNDLQELYHEDLFIASVLTRDTIETPELIAFKKDHHINYKILLSNKDDALAVHIAQELNIQNPIPIPLIVIYLGGKYYTHYEGSVPVEMLKYDIKQAKLQNNKDQR